MNIETQKQTKWCWAAVAVSVHKFLQSSPGSWSQGKLATRVLRDNGEIGNSVDCTQTPTPQVCNREARLDTALTVTGNLDTLMPGSHLPFADVKAWVDVGIPVAARVLWHGGGAHVILLDGYREYVSGAKQVHVQDSFYGPSYQYYDDLVADYPPGGNWQDTYTLK
jgi:hypothetical protein